MGIGGPHISGKTRLTGVMGWPVAHSLSPAMHTAAFRALGLDFAYLPLPVPPGRVEAAIRGLVALGFVGANVTVPHKPAALRQADEATPIARAVGAANTLVVRPDGSLLADSTDGAGFMADLIAHGIDPCRGPALVIGAGGAARAVAYALAEAGATVVVANRTISRAEALCEDVARALPSAAGRVSARFFPAAVHNEGANATLIVNATSLGLHEGDLLPWDPGVPFHSGQAAYDLVYNRPTAFLALATAGGARAVGGLHMLAYQGARSFELWTGCAAPVDVMIATLEEAHGGPALSDGR